MQAQVIIPKMGMSTVEVDLTQWYVKVGDRVEVDDALADVESEKALFTVKAETAGTVAEIRVELYETVDVGTVICVIETD